MNDSQALQAPLTVFLIFNESTQVHQYRCYVFAQGTKVRASRTQKQTDESELNF